MSGFNYENMDGSLLPYYNIDNYTPDINFDGESWGCTNLFKENNCRFPQQVSTSKVAVCNQLGGFHGFQGDPVGSGAVSTATLLTLWMFTKTPLHINHHCFSLLLMWFQGDDPFSDFWQVWRSKARFGIQGSREMKKTAKSSHRHLVSNS